MSNLHHTTAKIHELLPQVKAKYGLKFEVESEYYYDTVSKDNPLRHKTEILLVWKMSLDRKQLGRKRFIPAIQFPQIRQILIGLQGVLGENLNYHSKRLENYDEFLQNFKQNKPITAEYTLIKNKSVPQSKSQDLDDKWLRPAEKDGKYTGQSLFNREPETVLTELIQILQSI